MVQHPVILIDFCRELPSARSYLGSVDHMTHGDPFVTIVSSGPSILDCTRFRRVQGCIAGNAAIARQMQLVFS